MCIDTMLPLGALASHPWNLTSGLRSLKRSKGLPASTTSSRRAPNCDVAVGNQKPYALIVK
jgi:hypothetical protein